MKQLLGVKIQKWFQEVSLILHFPYKEFLLSEVLFLSHPEKLLVWGVLYLELAQWTH
jgi:hypothetical protein